MKFKMTVVVVSLLGLFIAGNVTPVEGREVAINSKSSVALFNDDLWGWQHYMKDNYYDYIYTQLDNHKSIKIGVIDTGIDHTHPEFSGVKFHKGYFMHGMSYGKPWENHFRSYYNDMDEGFKNCGGSKEKANVNCYHGTEVASIIAAKPNNRDGIVGIVPNAEIVDSAITVTIRRAGKSMDSWSHVARAIKESIDQGAKVINVSLTTYDAGGIDEVMKYAENKGVVVVAAAGNEPEKPIAYPAKHPLVVTVGGVDARGGDSVRYSQGPEVDIAAPSTNIMSASFGDKMLLRNGTSLGAPIVTGTVALLMMREPHLTPAQVRQRLYDTASRKPIGGRDDRIGHGVINMPGALGIKIPQDIIDWREGRLRPQPPSSPHPIPPSEPKPAPSDVRPSDNVPSNVPEPPVIEENKRAAVRLSGEDRVETAIDIAKNMNKNDNNSFVVIARADNYADAITASNVAKAHGAPLIVNNPDTLHPSNREYLLNAQQRGASVILVGGSKALSRNLENEISALGRNVKRIAGEDRIATSIAIANYVKDKVGANGVMISNGWNYEASVLAGSTAVRTGLVHVLANSGDVDSRAKQYAQKFVTTQRHFIGNAGEKIADLAVSGIFEDNISYLSVKTNKRFHCGNSPVGLATSVNFADGLTGGYHISMSNGCLYLMDPNEVSPRIGFDKIKSYLQGGPLQGKNSVYVYGGFKAMPPKYIDDLLNP